MRPYSSRTAWRISSFFTVDASDLSSAPAVSSLQHEGAQQPPLRLSTLLCFVELRMSSFLTTFINVLLG
jgi:hypothetical protein